MARISIVGAGQGGMQLAAGLLIDGHDVTLYSDRDEAALGSGRFPSSAAQFYTALKQQRDVGLDFWQGERLSNGFTLKVANAQGGVAIDWASEAFGYMQAVDQRLKFPLWMGYLKRCGAKVVIEAVDLARLDDIAADSDLTIVAAGKGDIAKMFAIDVEKTIFREPRRHIGLASVANVQEDDRATITLSLVPGVGEFVMIPGLTAYGPASFWVFEAVIGGPMDVWSDAKTPDAHLELSMELLRKFAPWDHERCEAVHLTDANGYLSGKVTPTVRKPIGTLPSGRKVVGMGDVVFLNDPICGQGANSAAKHATVFRQLIAERPEGRFDEAFMQTTFDRFWAENQWAMHFTNAVIAPSLPDHALQLLGAAQALPEVAHRFLGAYDQPGDLATWFGDPVGAAEFLQSAGLRQQLKVDAAAEMAKVSRRDMERAPRGIECAPSWANA